MALTCCPSHAVTNCETSDAVSEFDISSFQFNQSERPTGAAATLSQAGEALCTSVGCQVPEKVRGGDVLVKHEAHSQKHPLRC